MKKFSKIIENLETKKKFKVDAQIQLEIEASNEGEASYISDSILSSTKNQTTYIINKISEENNTDGN